ncbi:RNHCP domain-containing protein [Streptomyces sp. AM 4-1-1]|uniref:RNHCP domain-containing protein n=1 Tax=Streptomyces sp. AM 4-1-1 TaxID=3028710 RepID=UPI0023B9141D|nr:RNHCP domain-containing protein [Streptomyces sp. AM 4-1-1]WEH33621.1 RNHCP domain-containing protein [Streptomyces sp. AM 4-1-1]
MKHHHHDKRYGNEENKSLQRRQEDRAGGFRCSHCKRWVVINPFIGTANRNHCDHCLWSKHVDQSKGDRQATCHAGMEPIGLTFKNEGYGKQGELMLIHVCASCHKVSINRIARDDSNEAILTIYRDSLMLSTAMKSTLQTRSILLLNQEHEGEVYKQLFGHETSSAWRSPSKE